MSKVINKTWSIKDEGHLNKNNIIFTEKMRRFIKDLDRVNQSLGYYVLDQEDKWVKIEKIEIKEQ
jgi:hypothetical protein|tara:strand:- start:6 stop:200 length:195 start_codon:yes stop_codon:yes gene_type:complete